MFPDCWFQVFGNTFILNIDIISFNLGKKGFYIDWKRYLWSYQWSQDIYKCQDLTICVNNGDCWYIFMRIVSGCYYTCITRTFCSVLLHKWENMEEIHIVNFKTLYKYHLVHTTNISHVNKWMNRWGVQQWMLGRSTLNTENFELSATTDFRICYAILVETQMLEGFPYASLQSDHILWLAICVTWFVFVLNYTEIEKPAE